MRRAAVCVAFLAAVTTAPYARAVDLQNVLTGYALASWTDGDGRSLGGVSAIVQDLSGYLWLGTNAGLIRFDGWRFTQAEAAAGASVDALRWVGCRSAGLQACARRA